MAMSSWITLANSAAWGSGPSITAKFEYCYERSGADMKYQVRITINTLPYSTSYFGYPIYATIKLDSTTQVSGHTLKNASPSQWSSAIVYTTGVMTVSNKTSGSTSLSINLYSGSGESRDVTYNYTLTVAPAASNIDSVGSIETGSAVSVKWTPRNSAFKYNLTFKIGSTTIESVTGVSPGSTSQYNYTGYTPAHSTLPSSTSATVSVTLDTYSGSTKIGSDTKNFTLSVPASVVPSISSLSVSAVNDIAAFGSRFVAGKSAAQWSCSASPGSGSSIKGYVFSFAGVSGVAASGTTDVIPGDGSFTPSVTVTDNRGRSTTYTGPAITVYPYANPVITTAVAERCNNSGTADESGTRIAALLSATCSPVGGSNSVTIRVRKRATGGNWGSYTTLTQGTRQVLSGAISTTSSYQVELSAIDTAGNETVIQVSIPTAGVTFHLRKGGKGAAVGKYSEKEALECAWPAEFEDDVDVGGELRVGGAFIFDLIYPVGSLYMSINNTDPGTLFGGVWERIEDKFILSAGDTYAAGTTGGEATHTLTEDEMPSHSHTNLYYNSSSSGTPGITWGYNFTNNASHCVRSDARESSGGIGNRGGGQAHNNMPPYLTVYVWKRIALAGWDAGLWRDQISQHGADFASAVNSIIDSRGVDFIVEQGTSGIWTYTKWSSGRAEFYGLVSINVPNGWSNPGTSFNYPFRLTEVKYWGITEASYLVDRCYLSSVGNTSATIETHSNGSAMTSTFRIIVKGRWK